MVGGAPDSAPGVDLDRVAASMSQTSDSVSLAGSSSGPGSGARQLRSLAGAITGAAANFKSKLASAVTGARTSSSWRSRCLGARNGWHALPQLQVASTTGAPCRWRRATSPFR